MVKCLTPWDHQTERIYDASGAYPAVFSNSGGGRTVRPSSSVWPRTARTLEARYDSSPCLDRGQNVVVIGADVYNRPQSVLPVNLMVALRGGRDDMRTCFGVGNENDPQFTISAAHCHGVCYERPGDSL